MTDREAQEIVRMIESNWGIDLATARGIWRTELLPYTAEEGMRAVTSLAKNLEWRPKLPDLLSTLKMFRKRDEEVSAPYSKVEEGKYRKPPEWVWVWSWALFIRHPREERSFPQQNEADPQRTMSKEQYEALRDEWIAAGSPKLNNPVPLIGRSVDE